MKLGIVACDILKPEIEFITKDDQDFITRNYLEFALHTEPETMRNKIIDAVNDMKGQVDGVFLGYATCQSLEGVNKVFDMPVTMLEGPDCIGALLGPEGYIEEKKVCTGTWFVTPGWADEGVDGLIKELHLDSVEGYDPQYFLDILFDSYKRCLFIDTGIGNADRYRNESEAMAKTLKLDHECRKCGLESIEKAIAVLKGMCRQGRQ